MKLAAVRLIISVHELLLPFQPCECDAIGSISCNQTSGHCLCKDGVGGESCNTCRDAHFNFSSTGCRTCDCGLGSVNGSCDEQGQCYCQVRLVSNDGQQLVNYEFLQEGVSDLKCGACSEGYYSLSSQGCLPCLCSDRSNQCVLASNFTSSEPQELCDCPFPYEGLSCEGCM